MYEFLDTMFKNLDYLGSALLFLGLFRVGSFKLDGWLISLFGAILLILWGCTIEHYGIVIGNVAFGLVYLFNYFRFKKGLKI